MTNILISGGAGFIGSHLVDRLLELDHTVTILDDLSAGKIENVNLYAKLNIGTVEDLQTVRTIVKTYDIEVIFHLATPCLVKGLEDPVLMQRVDDLGTFNVCMVAREKDIKVVYISTSEIYGIQDKFPIKEDAKPNPVSLYGLVKLIGEEYVRFFHKVYMVPAVIIRPFNCYGPRHREDDYACVITRFLQRAKKGLPPMIMGDGLQSRDFSYVDDIVDGIMKLWTLGNGITVNLGSGKDINMMDLAKLVWKTYGYKSEPSIDWEVERPHDIRKLQADISLAKEYGYEPKISLEEGLKRYFNF